MELKGNVGKWTGRGFSVLGVLPFLLSGAMKLSGGPQIVEGFNHLGWPETMIKTVAALELFCAVVYLVPPISILGAILLTGYLGGAIATHLRLGEPVGIQVVLGVFVWAGLFLRDSKLRELLPIRAEEFTYERDITINRPRAEVFAFLKSVKNGLDWNPFLKKDPAIQIEYRGTEGQVGAILVWAGNRETGAGEHEVTKILEGRRIDFELRFQRPFKGVHHGYLAVEDAGANQSKVRWGITGLAPFPFNLIGLFISCEKMMGNDFATGLNDLKKILERS